MDRMERVDVCVEAELPGLDPEALRRHLARALDLLDAPRGDVSVLLTDDAHIHELNRRYRNVDAPTDVLSFGQAEDDGEAEPAFILPEEEDPILGDIVLSVDAAARQAAGRGHAPADEAVFLALHGLLHLLGLHHDTERDAEYRATMDRLTETILGRSIPH